MTLLDDRKRRIVRDCAGKDVLHIGCADSPYTVSRIEQGELLHSLLSEVSKSVIGVDTSLEGLGILRDRYPSLELHTPDDLPEDRLRNVEVVLAGETIEHVQDLESFCSAMAGYCAHGARLVITTPNAYSLKGSLRALFGSEFQHPDHVCLFSTKVLKGLMARHGFECVSEEYYNMDSKRLPMLPISVASKAISRISPRTSDGLYFTFRLR